MTGSSEDNVNGVARHANLDAATQTPHLSTVLQHHERLRRLTEGSRKEAGVTVRGDGLALADLVAASCHKLQCQITKDEGVLKRVDASVAFLEHELQEGRPVYGISTGFGGSADTRTSDFVNLQKALLQHQHAGILLPSDIGQEDADGSEALASLTRHRLPKTVVRGTMLARCNSLMRGHSAVRRDIIDAILKLLNLDFIPVIPLRGSISASGDLAPLSYIAGALEGNPGIYIDCPTEKGRKTLPSDEALSRAGMTPLTLGPKEGLGIMNGTVVSCTAATLALHETHYLTLLTQALTGMCTEALRGSTDNYNAFIAAARPHGGQLEAARNITRFLEGSKLAGSHHSGTRTGGLYQDRYALRTSTQWLAPYLEDLELASRQLQTELNSTTDNPLIDADTGRVHHGGNFQATSVTSATEKTRLALQMFGKLIFAQSSEVINPMLNQNLPPNLSFDDPSLSYTFKGIDINMAAYMSELGFLANPVSSHVQSAEMHNQAVNSLALISARYTSDAVEVVSMMCALHLYTCCQALDLQVMYTEYMEDIEVTCSRALEERFEMIVDREALKETTPKILACIRKGLENAKTKDRVHQAKCAAEATVTPLMYLGASCVSDEAKAKFIPAVEGWVRSCAEAIEHAIARARLRFAQSATSITPKHLSRGSKILYNFVRNELKVPLHKGLVEHATYHDASPEGIEVLPEDRALIGKQVSIIYAALRSGKIHGAVVESLS